MLPEDVTSHFEACELLQIPAACARLPYFPPGDSTLLKCGDLPHNVSNEIPWLVRPEPVSILDRIKTGDQSNINDAISICPYLGEATVQLTL